jgi:hypothetical protein
VQQRFATAEVEMTMPKNFGRAMLATITSEQFFMEFESARPGQSIVYHTGYLPLSRRAIEVDRVAIYAMSLQANGRADLFQRRLGAFEFEYLARKCHG